MPYISQELREQVDDEMDCLLEALESIDDEDIEGVMNYVLTTLLVTRFRPEGGWRYKWINRVKGTLKGVTDEFQERVAKPYEKQAVQKNGDIACYQEFPL